MNDSGGTDSLDCLEILVSRLQVQIWHYVASSSEQHVLDVTDGDITHLHATLGSKGSEHSGCLSNLHHDRLEPCGAVHYVRHGD